MTTEIEFTSATPFRFTVLGEIADDGSGEVVVDLTTVAAGSLAIANDLSELTASADTALGNLGGTAIGIDIFQAADEAAVLALLGVTSTGEDLITAASASAARTTLEMTLSPMYATAAIAVTTAGAVYLQVPTGITGTVTKITSVADGDPGGDVVFAPAIGTSGGAYTAITDGGFTIANGTAVGERDVATPSAANAVTGGTSIIRISWDNGAATAIVAGITVEIRSEERRV